MLDRIVEIIQSIGKKVMADSSHPTYIPSVTMCSWFPQTALCAVGEQGLLQ
jgi:hypothetical protein